jgi:RNA polymerase sigma-70 factor, ECF subfamily
MNATSSDRPAFDERFAALAALSYKVGYRLVGDRNEAEDLAQEALARAFASWRKVAAYDEAWVARVTANLAIGRWRKSRRLVGDQAGGSRDGSDDGAAHRGRPGWVRPLPPPDPVDHLELVAALRSLPQRQREVVALRYLADLPESEVAAAMGCTTGTVKQHASRGLAALRRRLAHLGPSVATPDAEEEPSVRASR